MSISELKIFSMLQPRKREKQAEAFSAKDSALGKIKSQLTAFRVK